MVTGWQITEKPSGERPNALNVSSSLVSWHYFLVLLAVMAAMAEHLGHMDTENENFPTSDNLDEEERLEREHFMKIIHAFLSYRSCSQRKLEKRVADFASIPLWHRKLTPEYAKRLKESRACIDENQKLINLIVDFTDGMFRNTEFKVSGQ